MLTKLKRNKKGFTLAELLIVVAIIAILIAIAIPTFSGALNKAKQATDDANIRAAYSQYVVTKMTNREDPGTASDTEVAAAFSDIGVSELEYYSYVSIPSDGTNWSGGGTGGASSITTTNPD